MIKRAFTLIELLVVIAIIGLLAGAVSVAFSESRKSSRDSKRISEMKALQTAITMFYDNNGRYPYSGSCGGYNLWGNASNGWCNSEASVHDSGNRWIKDGGVASALAGYIGKDPFDPKDDSTPVAINTEPGSYTYWSVGDYCGAKRGQYYVLGFALEKKGSDFEKTNDVANLPFPVQTGNCAPPKLNWDGSNANGAVLLYEIQ